MLSLCYFEKYIAEILNKCFYFSKEILNSLGHIHSMNFRGQHKLTNAVLQSFFFLQSVVVNYMISFPLWSCLSVMDYYFLLIKKILWCQTYKLCIHFTVCAVRVQYIDLSPKKHCLTIKPAWGIIPYLTDPAISQWTAYLESLHSLLSLLL